MSSSSAPGPAAGYFFQLERALLHLVNGNRGDKVGIETLDDVSVVQADGIQILEQDKHSISGTGHPLTDRSRQLWRTLEIWAKALHNGALQIGQTEFHLVTNRPLPDGLANRIGEAKGAREVAAVIAQMRAEAAKPADQVSGTISAVLAAPESLLMELVSKVSCIDGRCDSTSSVRGELAKRIPLPRGIDASSVVDELAGWLQGLVLQMWRGRQPAWIDHESYANQLHAIVDRRKRERSHERSSRLLPEPDPTEVGQHRSRTFVRQIQLVSDDDDTVNEAIRCYIQARDEKFRLSQEGDLTRDDWLDFDNRLFERWRRLSRQSLRVLPKTASDECQGAELLTLTLEHLERLAGQPTNEHYLTSGSYHNLADEPRLGWHPKWESHFKSKK